MRNLFLLVAFLLPLIASAQFPTNPNRLKLGQQTTALGIINYSDTIPLHTPASWLKDTEVHVDTSEDVRWWWTGASWRVSGEVRRMTAPPSIQTIGGRLYDWREAVWWRDTDSTFFRFNYEGECWQPLMAFRGDTIPADEAAIGSSAAVCYTASPWYDTDADSLKVYTGGAWLAVNEGNFFVTESCEYVENKIVADDAAAGDAFGWRVDIYDTVAVVGAPFDNTTTGAAYVFTLSGNTWTQTAKLTASDAAVNDGFGRGVAIYDTTIVVGAQTESSTTGAAYIFNYNNGNWTETAKITASDAATGDYFGEFVAIYDTTIVISAARKATNTGAAYVFNLNGGSWTQTAKLTASDADVNAYFSSNSLAIYDTTIVVGALGDDAGGSFAGAAYVFNLDGGGWTEVAKLTASTPIPGNAFGGSVSIYDTTIVIGGTNGQQVYIFNGSGASWTQEQVLTSSIEQPGEGFGFLVSIDGAVIVAGAPESSNGYATVFNFADGVWSETSTFFASDAEAGDRYGYGVATSGEKIIIGARQSDDAGSNSGSAYIYDLPCTTTYTNTLNLNFPNLTGYPTDSELADTASALRSFIGSGAYGNGIYDGPTSLLVPGQTRAITPDSAGIIWADDELHIKSSVLIDLQSAVSVNNNRIQNVANPSAATDAVNRQTLTDSLNLFRKSIADSAPTGSTDTLDLASRYVGVYQIDLTSASSPLTLTVQNPIEGGVYTFHWLNASSNDIVYPATFYDESATTLGTVSYAAPKFITCYYDGSNFYCK